MKCLRCIGKNNIWISKKQGAKLYKSNRNKNMEKKKFFKNQMQMENKYNKTQFLLDATGEQNTKQ